MTETCALNIRSIFHLILFYGITEHPMMLVPNKDISSKDDMIRIVRT